MEERMSEDMLYCVGCGQPVAKLIPGQTLAIACACGANAPILHTLDGRWAPPASLVRATGAMIPHIEYYLGFSDHQSIIKTEVTRMLRAFGSISYTECSDPNCRAAFERSKERHLERENRRRDPQ